MRRLTQKRPPQHAHRSLAVDRLNPLTRGDNIMNVKRIAVAVLASAALPLAACGSSDEVKAGAPEPAKATRSALGWPWVETAAVESSAIVVTGAGGGTGGRFESAASSRSPLGWPWVEESPAESSRSPLGWPWVDDAPAVSKAHVIRS
jgi:hypothetical protein